MICVLKKAGPGCTTSRKMYVVCTLGGRQGVLPQEKSMLCVLQEADKVYYIQYIKDLPLKEARAAEMSVMTGHYQDAENYLLQAGLVYRAIQLNIYLHQWEKALELAIKHKTHVDTVLAFRLKYLERCDKDETNAKYIQYNKEVEVDWDKVNQKIEEEFKNERVLKTSPTKPKKPARQ